MGLREIVTPERLVMTSDALEDENGNPQLEVRTTITFAEHGGKTKLTLHAVVLKATPEAATALAGAADRQNGRHVARRPNLLILAS